MADVKLFALSTCPYCKQARAYLDESSVTYELVEVDLLAGDERGSAVAEVRRISGGTSFPVMVANGEVIVGFDKSRIREAIGLPQ